MTVGTGDADWRGFARKRWRIVAAFGAAAVVAFVSGVYVFLWFVSNAQSSGLVPSSLGLWTMGHLVIFILTVIFWELLIIGIPVAVAGVLGWQWWTRLPEGDRTGLRFRTRSRTTRGGGGLSTFFFIAFIIKVYLDGNWNVPISSFSLNYVVGSMVTILIWTAVLLGVPAAIAVVWWIRREKRGSRLSRQI